MNSQKELSTRELPSIGPLLLVALLLLLLPRSGLAWLWLAGLAAFPIGPARAVAEEEIPHVQ